MNDSNQYTLVILGSEPDKLSVKQQAFILALSSAAKELCERLKIKEDDILVTVWFDGISQGFRFEKKA